MSSGDPQPPMTAAEAFRVLDQRCTEGLSLDTAATDIADQDYADAVLWLQCARIRFAIRNTEEALAHAAKLAAGLEVARTWLERNALEDRPQVADAAWQRARALFPPWQPGTTVRPVGAPVLSAEPVTEPKDVVPEAISFARAFIAVHAGKGH